MAKKKKNLIPLLSGSTIAIIIFIWLAMPVIAGMFKIGEPAGPKIYPREMHKSLYKMGNNAAGNDELDFSFYKEWIYERPWFYGMKRTTIPQSKAEETWDSTKKWLHEATE